MKQDKQSFLSSWFFRLLLNNQGITSLVIILLVFLNILVFSKISPLLAPIFSFLAVVILPLVMSAVVYYLLKPLVDWLENQGFGKIAAISIVFTGVAVLLVGSIATLIPMLHEQLMSFVKNLPNYVREVEQQSTQILQDERLEFFRPQLEGVISEFSSKALEYAQTISRSAVNWAGNVAGAIARVTVAIIITPFIIFYFLRDGKQMKETFVNQLPTAMRPSVSRVLSGMNSQLSSYVQGQVTVAIVVGIMFSILFTIIGLPYAVTFGISAGFLNMVPYLGSFLAMVPVVILALVEGPLMLAKVAVVFTLEQTIEGRFVTPLVLGSKLSIHPITIMFILLTAGASFGVWGVFLGIPIYAAIKVIVVELFDWYKSVSGLYEDKTELVTEEETSDVE